MFWRERITPLQLQPCQLKPELFIFFFIFGGDSIPFLRQVADMTHIAFHLEIKEDIAIPERIYQRLASKLLAQIVLHSPTFTR